MACLFGFIGVATQPKSIAKVSFAALSLPAVFTKFLP